MPTAVDLKKCGSKTVADANFMILFGAYASAAAATEDLSFEFGGNRMGPYALGIDPMSQEAVVFGVLDTSPVQTLQPLETYGFTLHRAVGSEPIPTRKPQGGSIPRRAPATVPERATGSGISLAPNTYGHVTVVTKSGRTACMIESHRVICQTSGANWPAIGVEITADGSVRFENGELGDIRPVTLRYETYTAMGWTIVASRSGTRFTNDRTGRGAFVSVEAVRPF